MHCQPTALREVHPECIREGGAPAGRFFGRLRKNAFRAHFPERRGLAMHSRTPRVPQSKKKLIELPAEAWRAPNNSKKKSFRPAKPGIRLRNFFQMHVDFLMRHDKLDFAAETRPDALLGDRGLNQEIPAGEHKTSNRRLKMRLAQRFFL